MKETYKSRVYTDRPAYADFDTPAKFQAIQSIVAKHLTQHPKAICSYSGGADSDILIDLIERTREIFNLPPVKYAFFNTGLEMQATKDHVKETAEKYGVDLISLIAPTSEDRIAMIAREAEGFLYIVSSLGVTGMRSEIKTDLESIVETVRENTDVPCAIGFGISTPEQAAKMAGISDGAIVGSAIVRLIGKYGKDAPEYVGEYVKGMKDALR